MKKGREPNPPSPSTNPQIARGLKKQGGVPGKSEYKGLPTAATMIGEDGRGRGLGGGLSSRPERQTFREVEKRRMAGIGAGGDGRLGTVVKEKERKKEKL